VTGAGEDRPASLNDFSLSEIRSELRKLLTLAETAHLPLPDREVPDVHAFGPGWEWRVKYRADVTYDPRRLWSVIQRNPDDLAGVVYIHTPDSLTGDYLATSTTEARELAMAILAACDRADQQAAGIPNLADRRSTKRPRKGTG
jgi:hypothetical protein